MRSYPFGSQLAIGHLTIWLLITQCSCDRKSDIQYDEVTVKSENSFYVTKVIDGDTFYVKDTASRNGEDKIRLIGIDAPETRTVFEKEKHPFGDSSKSFLVDLIEMKSVYLEFDIDSTDRYGRMLCYAFVGEDVERIFVNAEVLRQGYGWIMTVPPNVRYVDTLLNSQKEAREKSRGLWRDFGGIQPEQQ